MHISKSCFDTWVNKSFMYQIVNARNNKKLSSDLKKKYYSILSKLRIENDFDIIKGSPVDGNITRGWVDQNISGPLFQKSLEKVMKVKRWTPAEYLVEYFLDCCEEYSEFESCDLGRALRNLPSFLREYFLASMLNELGVNTEVPTANMNASCHADLKIRHKGETIYGWSYINSPKSITYLRKKLHTRGKIMDKNILLPLHLSGDTENIHNWLMPSKEYAREIVDSLDDEPVPFKHITFRDSLLKKITVFLK
jgi:hypothetical protein